MPLCRGNAEILCDERQCPSFVPDSYSPRGVHTYPIAYLYRSAGLALHAVGDAFHVGSRDGSELEFPFGFLRSVLQLDERVRFVAASGDELSLREATPEAARGLAEALARVGLRARVIEVDEASLIAAPEARHGQLVRLETTWSTGFERSAAAGAWVTTAPDVDFAFARTERRVRISGLWLCQPRKVYGHLGGYAAELLAYAIEPIDPTPDAG